MTGTRLLSDWLFIGTRETIRDGAAIDIDADGRIESMGVASHMPPTNKRVQNVGGLLMPGLINAHAHGPMTLVRSAGDGLPLMRWLTEAVWPREGAMTPEDVWWGQALAACEMLRAGITTSVEMYLFEDQVVDAMTAVGQRVHAMAGLITAILPDEAAFEARVGAILDFAAKHHNADGRVRVGFGAHSVWDLGPDRVATVAAEAQRHDLTLHIHLEETSAEREQVLAEHGRTATKVLADGGALDGHVVAAHGVWLDADDRRLLGDAKATVVHCPSSNLKLGSGIADIAALLDAGVQVAVGTDGAASNDDLNLWEDLRLAAMLARGTAHDPTLMSAPTTLGLATGQAGPALGMPTIGTLYPGCWADVIRIDLDHPSLTPTIDDDIEAQVLWAAGPQHVTDVWVAGQRVVDAGAITTIDEGEVMQQATTRGRRLLA